MNLQRKINATISFLNHNENISNIKQNLYDIVSCLHKILTFQLESDVHKNIENPFNHEFRKHYIDMAISYLNVHGQNQGDECSLMVRYVRNYFESLEYIQEHGETLLYKPRLERSMNILSPFFL